MTKREIEETSIAYAAESAMVPQGNRASVVAGDRGWRQDGSRASDGKVGDRRRTSKGVRAGLSLATKSTGTGVGRVKERISSRGRAALPERCRGKVGGATRTLRWPPGSRVLRLARGSHPTLATETRKLRRPRRGWSGRGRGNGGRQQCRPLFACRCASPVAISLPPAPPARGRNQPPFAPSAPRANRISPPAGDSRSIRPRSPDRTDPR